jgi:hypothetical protein
MRRVLTVTLLTLLAAAALATTAAAKEMSVALSGGPPSDPPGPGGSWDAELLVHGEPDILSQATPGISIFNRSTGEEQNYAAKATGKKAADGQLLYRVHVVFPTAGLWDYTLIDGVTDRAYEGGTIQIGEPAMPTPATPPAQTAADDSSGVPVWPFALGGAALLLAAGAAAFALTHRRPQPSA